MIDPWERDIADEILSTSPGSSYHKKGKSAVLAYIGGKNFLHVIPRLE